MDNSKLIFGGVLVLILLGIYVYLVTIAVLVVLGRLPRESFTPEMASTLSLIGGLVSALVIAELAVTSSVRTGRRSQIGDDGVCGGHGHTLANY